MSHLLRKLVIINSEIVALAKGLPIIALPDMIEIFLLVPQIINLGTEQLKLNIQSTGHNFPSNFIARPPLLPALYSAYPLLLKR